jgi:alkylation response protein AidB-like acyl-CoA dehydrogenase
MFTPNFTFTAGPEKFRSAVRDLLRSEQVQREVAAARESPTRHPAAVYRELGQQRFLAPDWSAEYGGLGATIISSAIVAEEMALAGVPDSARVNTVDNAGSTLLAGGTPAQKATYLPGMAAGQCLAVVLYSEPGAGSDLAGLLTRAERDGEGWRLTGEKIWNVGAADADFGICLARTGEGSSKYAGLSLFLVPLDVAGVQITEVPGINPEAFSRVSFDGAALPPDALIGPLGGGWQLANEALTVERTGAYFYGRARRWLDLLSRAGPPGLPASCQEAIAGLRAELAAARMLTWRCLDLMARGEEAGGVAAAAKWSTTDLATRVAGLAWRVRDLIRDGDQGDPLSDALREVPGLTIAGGTSEMMLATVSAVLLDSTASGNTGPDNMVEVAL